MVQFEFHRKDSSRMLVRTHTDEIGGTIRIPPECWGRLSGVIRMSASSTVTIVDWAPKTFLLSTVCTLYTCTNAVHAISFKFAHWCLFDDVSEREDDECLGSLSLSLSGLF